jgi:hypothetical protein
LRSNRIFAEAKRAASGPPEVGLDVIFRPDRRSQNFASRSMKLRVGASMHSRR